MILVKVDNDTFVNIDKVSNINIVEDKTVLNMGYNVSLPNTDLISGFYYINESKLRGFKDLEEFKDKFIYLYGSDRKVYLNRSQISSIKKDIINCKIIISFTHSVEFNGKIVPEYMYVRYDNIEDLESSFKYLQNSLRNTK